MASKTTYNEFEGKFDIGPDQWWTGGGGFASISIRSHAFLYSYTLLRGAFDKSMSSTSRKPKTNDQSQVVELLFVLPVQYVYQGALEIPCESENIYDGISVGRIFEEIHV